MTLFPPETQRAWKDPVRVVATSNVTIASPGTTIDGITLASGDRVLLTGQTTTHENRIWTFNGSAAAMTAPVDAFSAYQWGGQSAVIVPTGAVTVAVREGTAGAGTVWMCTTAGSITPGTTGLAWRRIDNTTPWSTLFVARGSWAASAASGTYVLAVGGNAALTSAALASDGAIAPLDPADYAITGRTVQIRLVSELITTAALTAGNANTIQFGLYPVTAITTAGVMTVGAATTQNTAIANQAASTFGRQAGTALTMPAAGQYLLGATTSGAMSATQASVPHYSVMLQSRVV